MAGFMFAWIVRDMKSLCRCIMRVQETLLPRDMLSVENLSIAAQLCDKSRTKLLAISE